MRLLLLADIHIGLINDPAYTYEVISEIIDQEVIFQKTDAVIILGDYFHRLFKVNEDHVSTAINLMTYLINACKREGTKIRIVYGTESHEMGQYKLFNYQLSQPDIDIKLITTVTEEELFPDVNVLYIPEEYILDKKNHYKDTLYSNKHYRYIFGHGTIVEGVPPMMAIGGKSPTTKSGGKEKTVPRFKNHELSMISDLCVFGHYHCYTPIGDNSFYLGSLFRNAFGEEFPKGYGVVEDDRLMFKPNNRAYLFQTYPFDKKDPIFTNADEIAKAVNGIKSRHPDIFDGTKRGKIRMMLDAPHPMDVAWKEALRTILKNERHVTFALKEPLPEVTEEIEEKESDEFDFLIDNGLSITEKVYRFIGIKQPDSPMTYKQLQEYIDRALSKK